MPTHERILDGLDNKTKAKIIELLRRRRIVESPSPKPLPHNSQHETAHPIEIAETKRKERFRVSVDTDKLAEYIVGNPPKPNNELMYVIQIQSNEVVFLILSILGLLLMVVPVLYSLW